MNEKHSPWWVVGPAVLAVAITAAGFAIVFRSSLSLAMHALGGRDIVAVIDRAPPWKRLLLPALGGLGAGFIALALVRRRGTSGVGFVMEAIVLGRVRVPLLRSGLQMVSSWLAIVGGNSLGREGPLIQAGAAAGEAARRAFRLTDASAQIVLASGVAAGFAAAYNAPMAATLFVIEVVTGVVVLEAAVSILIAAVITRYALGVAPLYGHRDFGSIAPVELLAFAGLGILAAPVGVGFLRLLALAEKFWRVLPLPVRLAAGGLVCGCILIVLPHVAGNGFEPLDALLDGRIAVGTAALLLIAKPLATAASVGAGNPGGVFTPTLLIGGLLGAVVAAGLAACGANVTPGAYALVGLAAALSATTHAPIMAAVLAGELSGDFALVLPLLIACAFSSLLARWLYIDSIYTEELRRRGLRWRLTLEGQRRIEQLGSPVAGRDGGAENGGGAQPHDDEPAVAHVDPDPHE